MKMLLGQISKFMVKGNPELKVLLDILFIAY